MKEIANNKKLKSQKKLRLYIDSEHMWSPSPVYIIANLAMFC